VRAFRQLAFDLEELDLEELDAPTSMVTQAQLAAQDEANHARWTLARGAELRHARAAPAAGCRSFRCELQRSQW